MANYRFASVFGSKDWKKLPQSLKKFYAVSSEKKEVPFCGSLKVTYKSKMGIPWMWILYPVNLILRLVVPTPHDKIQIFGKLEHTKDKDVIKFDRDYVYPSGKKLQLHSNWLLQGGNRVVEFIGPLIGWRFFVNYIDGRVVLSHDAFVIKLGLLGVWRLPLSWLIVGKGHAEQKALDRHKMHIKMTLTHFLFGEYYVYEGVLSLKKKDIDAFFAPMHSGETKPPFSSKKFWQRMDEKTKLIEENAHLSEHELNGWLFLSMCKVMEIEGQIQTSGGDFNYRQEFAKLFEQATIEQRMQLLNQTIMSKTHSQETIRNHAKKIGGGIEIGQVTPVYSPCRGRDWNLLLQPIKANRIC